MKWLWTILLAVTVSFINGKTQTIDADSCFQEERKNNPWLNSPNPDYICTKNQKIVARMPVNSVTSIVYS